MSRTWVLIDWEIVTNILFWTSGTWLTHKSRFVSSTCPHSTSLRYFPVYLYPYVFKGGFPTRILSGIHWVLSDHPTKTEWGNPRYCSGWHLETGHRTFCCSSHTTNNRQNVYRHLSKLEKAGFVKDKKMVLLIVFISLIQNIQTWCSHRQKTSRILWWLLIKIDILNVTLKWMKILRHRSTS